MEAKRKESMSLVGAEVLHDVPGHEREIWQNPCTDPPAREERPSSQVWGQVPQYSPLDVPP